MKDSLPIRLHLIICNFRRKFSCTELRVASTEDKKPFAADEPKTVTENSNSNISDELRDMRSRLKPVKPPVGFPSKKDAEIEDRKSVNQTRVDNKPVRESRRPSKDATAPADGIAVLSESRATNGKAKSPSRKPNAAVESKALLLAPSPPLPSRTRQPSPSPQRNNEEASARSSEPRSESGRDVVKATAVVAREKGGVVNNGHLPSKDSGLRTTAARESTPTRLTDNKLSGTSPFINKTNHNTWPRSDTAIMDTLSLTYLLD